MTLEKVDRFGEPIPGLVTEDGGQWCIGDCFIDGARMCWQIRECRTRGSPGGIQINAICPITPQCRENTETQPLFQERSIGCKNTPFTWVHFLTSTSHRFDRWTPLENGRAVFVKRNPKADPCHFENELRTRSKLAATMTPAPEIVKPTPQTEGDELFAFFKKRNHD